MRNNIRLTSEIRTGLIRTGSCTGGLPAGNVDGLDVFRHLRHLYGVKTAADTSELAKLHAAKATYAPYVCEGVPFFACSLSKAKSFLPSTLEGYWMGRVPRFETTSAAVYGRVTRANRGLCEMQ